MRNLVFALPLLVTCTPAPPAGTTSSPSGAPAGEAAPAPVKVDGAKAQELVKAGAKLVDVRSPGEYQDGHIDGAENVPVDTVQAKDFGPKDQPIVVYCQAGSRAARAAATLRAKGYTKVYDLGGMSNWKR